MGARWFRNCCLTFAAAACGLSAVSLGQTPPNANQYIQDTGPIFAYLLDTGTPSASPLTAKSIEDKLGWTALQEGDIKHAFSGDAVILNDRIAIVLRKQGRGAEVYARNAAGYAARALIAPRGSGAEAATALDHSRIADNTTGAIEIEAVYKSAQGKPLALALRLATGQIQVQMAPGAGVDAVRVEAETDAIVVPDFFADDVVYRADSMRTDAVRLPAENFYMHFLGGGSGIVTCIWQSCGRDARALTKSGGKTRTIEGSEIECVEGKTVWVAFAEGKDIWRTEDIAPSSKTLTWNVPFSAKWRADVVSKSEAAQSTNFVEAPTATPSGASCWLDGATANVDVAALGAPNAASVVTYPIDRTRATPLDTFLLIDIMRSTLGVGACQYILDLEGLDAQTTPTPELVCEYVEGQLKKKRARQGDETLRQRLDAMVAHVQRAEERIGKYRAAGAKMREACAASPNANDADFAALAAMVSELETTCTQLAPARRSASDVKALADRLAGLAGNDAWQAPFDKIHNELRAIGAAQDRTMAKCRMTLRRVNVYCLSLVEQGGALVDLARNVQTLASQALAEKG